MKDFFDATISANKEIYELIQNGLEAEHFQSTTKGAGGDISSKIDLIAEDIFIKHLLKFGDILSEEKGLVQSKNSEFQIIIDPIDGSDNLASNVPYFGTSVALKKAEKTVAGVIVNLANGDIFIKDTQEFTRGNLNNLVLKKVISNPHAKLGFFERSYSSVKFATLFREYNIKYRSPGAFALSLAYAHDVNFVFYEGSLRIFDVAAGEFFCEDLYTLKTPSLLLVSKNKEIFDKISKFI